MNKKHLLCCFVIALGFACKKQKEEITTIGQGPANTLNSSIFHDLNGTHVTNYLYAATGQLARSENKGLDGNLVGFNEYHYGSSGVLNGVTINSISGKAGEEIYTYQNGKLIKSLSQGYLDGVLRDLYEHTYEYTNNQLTRVNFAYKNNAPSTFTNSYVVYQWNAGNIINKKTYDVSGTLKAETTYEYDNKPNPFFELSFYGIELEKYLSANNVTKAVTTDFVHGVTGETTTNFTYNHINLPVKQFNAHGVGNKVHQFDYTYN